jgi:hypothetical protein
MTALPEEGYRLGHHMIGGDDQLIQPATPVLLEDLQHPIVVDVALHEKSEEKAGVEEDQSRGSP